MEKYHGTGVSPGIAVGRIKVYQKRGQTLPRSIAADSETEICRYEQAAGEALKLLAQLKEKAIREAGPEQAAIFDVYQMILADQQFDASVKNIIRKERAAASYAVAKARDQLATMFAGMDDAYMKERAADIVDVTGRVLEALEKADGFGKIEADTEEPYILFAENLLPSETVQLDRSKALAFVTTGGSPNSHVAILARAMGIPAVVGADVPLSTILDGSIGIVDGAGGTVCLDPDTETMADMRRAALKLQAQKEQLQALKGKETCTPGGQRLLLYANIGREEDLAAALDNDAEGIGLFRSEFLYLGRNSWPGEEEQFAVYRRIVQAMEGKRVIIRTMDIGADKTCGYFGLEPEENPALGRRGIRVSLTRPEPFKTQLRAIFRAAAFGQAAVMYPMITSVREVHMIREIVRQVETELKEQGMAYRVPEQGIMIETPAAALISAELAREVDFFSIGTNDLTQYTLAVDRQNASLEEFYDACHPAVMRLIAMTAENAHEAGIWVGICGELAADVSLTGEFLAMGIDELSVSPEHILAVRRAVREN